MAKIKEVISKVNLSESIPDSIKYRWIGELEGKKFRCPDDADAELRYPFAVYEKYMIAMDDFFRFDMEAYRKSAEEFRRVYASEGLLF